jgi:hypothetical protein
MTSERIIIPGPKELLVGGSGSGKTHSIRTIIECGLKVAAVFTEPGQEVLADIPCEDGFHFTYIPPSAPDWDVLLDVAKKINTMSMEMLAKQRDINKRKYDEWWRFITAMSNFTCDRCGQSFGPTDELGADWCVVNDSLSGMSQMAMNLVTGAQPVKAQPDYGIAMTNLEAYITKFTTGIRCMAVMTAHLEMEGDELSGGQKLMPSTLGRKLAPKIPRYFSDVILCERNGAKWTWNTESIRADLKTRALPVAAGLAPTFKPVIDLWRKRNGSALSIRLLPPRRSHLLPRVRAPRRNPPHCHQRHLSQPARPLHPLAVGQLRLQHPAPPCRGAGDHTERIVVSLRVGINRHSIPYFSIGASNHVSI